MFYIYILYIESPLGKYTLLDSSHLSLAWFRAKLITSNTCYITKNNAGYCMSAYTKDMSI